MMNDKDLPHMNDEDLIRLRRFYAMMATACIVTAILCGATLALIILIPQWGAAVAEWEVTAKMTSALLATWFCVALLGGSAVWMAVAARELIDDVNTEIRRRRFK